jgi:hypothetical protein
LAWYEKTKEKKFHNNEELLATAWITLMCWGRHAEIFRILFLKLVKMDSFRRSITISSICNKVYRKMFLKPDTVGIIPRRGTVWETDNQLKLFNGWRLLVTYWRYNSCRKWEVHLPGLPNVKVDRYSPKTKEVFEYLGCFGMGVPACPIAPQNKHCWPEMRKKASLQKIKNSGYTVVSIWGASLENCCEKILALKMNIVRTLTSRTLHWILGTPCTGVEPRPQKHITELSRGRQSTMWIFCK